MAEISSNCKKALWEKEKLLIMSNFPFSHSVFKKLVLKTGKNLGLVWEKVNTLPNDKIFNSLKWKHSDDKRDVVEMVIFIFDGV